MARFEREARAVAALSHPNILAIHDFGSDGDVTFAVTELLEGETLRSRLARDTMSLERAIEVGAAVAEGLAAAHAKGITHRDIKPENIFLTREHQVKILDFGLARYTPGPVPDEATSLPTETEPGTVMGTLGYMSPEQARGETAGPASDIFSLGAVLYEMVTGRRAFARTTPGETFAAILRDEPPPAEAGAEVNALIARCLEKDPARRFQSAKDLAFTLRTSVGRGQRRLSRPWGRIVAAASTLLLAGTAGYWIQMRSREPIDSLAVLPFAHIGSNPNTEYLSEGISESLITDLPGASA